MQSNKQQQTSTSSRNLLIGFLGVALGLGKKYILDEFIFNSNKNEDKEKKDKSEKEGKLDLHENKSESRKDSINYQMDFNIDQYESFLCPIGQEIMKDPVITPLGISYERNRILMWLRNHKTCPITKAPLSSSELIPNLSLKNAIEEFMKKQNLKTKINK